MHRGIPLWDKVNTYYKPNEIVFLCGDDWLDFNIPHQCIVKGDSKYLSIAAASILAKTYRDDIMHKLHEEYNYYKWNKTLF